MEIIPYLLLIIVFMAAVITLYNLRSVTLLEYENGLLYRNGKFVQLLGAGRHWYFQSSDKVTRVDLRARYMTISGQEVLSSDNVGLKLSIAINFKVEDPYKTIHVSNNPQEALYMAVQIALRDMVGSMPVDDLLAKRREISSQLLEAARQASVDLGYSVVDVNIKDIMFPGELKNIFAQVVNAKKEGLASLERARGETAALRSLANAARMLEGNPQLMNLRLVQAMQSSSGNTLILNLAGPDGDLAVQSAGKHGPRPNTPPASPAG